MHRGFLAIASSFFLSCQAFNVPAGHLAWPRSAIHRTQQPRLCADPEQEKTAGPNDLLYPKLGGQTDNGGLQDSGATSFASYILPYVGLILLAFALAAGAFAALVLGG